jgi:hypothetical protein
MEAIVAAHKASMVREVLPPGGADGHNLTPCCADPANPPKGHDFSKCECNYTYPGPADAALFR